MLIELIYRSGCPNVGRTRQNLLKALARAGVPAQWTEWDSSDPVAPDYTRHFDSPTILVDGRDVASYHGIESGGTCRLYAAGTASLSGAPGVELIAAAVVWKELHQPSGSRWRRGLAVLPGAGVAFLPKLACPACWPAYAAVLSSLGLGFLLSTRALFGLSLVFLGVTLSAIALAGRRRQRYLPLAAGIAAAGAILMGKFAVESPVLLYAGVAGLLAAGLWSNWPPRRSPRGKCRSCEGINSKEQNDAKETTN